MAEGGVGLREPMTRHWAAAPVAWKTVGILAASKVAFQLATSNLYGAHRDEFYYLESGHHLAWGYVDNPPLVPVLYRVEEVLFGHSVTALAVIPALLGGLYVLLAVAMTADLGGARRAQLLAATVAWLGPLFLTTSHFLSTVSLDLVFWALASWLVIHLVRTGDHRWWLAVGAVCGVGLLNKDTIMFWAVATGVALLATPQRSLLRTPWLVAGLAIALVIALPNIVWQVQHQWPTLEFLRNLRTENSSSDLSQFVQLQLGVMTLAGTAVWVVALRALWRRPEWRDQRWLAHGFLVAFVLLFGLAGKAYYLASWYLPLVAIGAVVIERRWSISRQRLLMAAVVLTGLLSAPVFTPVLPPDAAVSLGLDTANKDLGGMLGWPQVVAQVAAVYHGLPPAERRRAVVFAADYSEAGAVDFYGSPLGLPSAISGHNSFWLWGYGKPAPGAVVVAVGLPPDWLPRYWSSVQTVAILGQGANIDPQEQGAPISVCQGQTTTWATLWPAAKHYD